MEFINVQSDIRTMVVFKGGRLLLQAVVLRCLVHVGICGTVSSGISQGSEYLGIDAMVEVGIGGPKRMFEDP